ncbi:MAG: SWIM zinc finger family protein [Deltaproteobacteria bacterium]|nr:SWIM zinc finger family protein [Deltaproteobacteria bacterium]
MQMTLGYRGHSGVSKGDAGSQLRFAPNLARPKVSFDGELVHPVRYREAISALHAVVVGDLRFKRRDPAAYLEWKKQEEIREAELRQQIFRDLKKQQLEGLGKEQPPPGLEKDFQKMHALYWKERRRWAAELGRDDPQLFRHLVPCDPVVTVAPDVVYFECFSKDESSYGCLLVDRDAFKGQDAVGLGTTNVDYSLALYEHFQTLRTYRPTRLLVDPRGFEVKVESMSDYREEKIDLPPSWLRGFGQISAAMTLPSRKVVLPTEAVYSILAYLKRHREKTGPRSIRFKLTPGRAPVIVLDPWGVEIDTRDRPYEGERAEEIKVWGRRRLMALSRVLPLAERVEVRLLGTGMPSIWIAHLGEMRFVLALSGWTTNDWTSGASLELLAKNLKADADTVEQLTSLLMAEQKAPLSRLAQQTQKSADLILGSLFRLAQQGQVVYDFSTQSYRYRQVMPVTLSEAVLGPEPIEISEGRRLARSGEVQPGREEPLTKGRRLVTAKVAGVSCEAIFDADLGYGKAKCTCKHHHKLGMKAGPCRHLLALKLHLAAGAQN